MEADNAGQGQEEADKKRVDMKPEGMKPEGMKLEDMKSGGTDMIMSTFCAKPRHGTNGASTYRILGRWRILRCWRVLRLGHIPLRRGRILPRWIMVVRLAVAPLPRRRRVLTLSIRIVGIGRRRILSRWVVVVRLPGVPSRGILSLAIGIVGVRRIPGPLAMRILSLTIGIVGIRRIAGHL